MGILDKIFKKKPNVQSEGQTTPTVSLPAPVDDKPLPIVNDLVMPKNLHSATRMIVDKHGDVFLEQKAFVNMLNDYQLLRESPVIRNVLRNLQSGGCIGAGSIVEYNQKGTMPYLIVVIDDFGAMMQERSKLMEQYFSTICRRGRIVGVHVIAATQYSTRNVLTTTVRSLFVSRLSFRLMNVADSRLMLNTGIADINREFSEKHAGDILAGELTKPSGCTIH